MGKSNTQPNLILRILGFLFGWMLKRKPKEINVNVKEFPQVKATLTGGKEDMASLKFNLDKYEKSPTIKTESGRPALDTSDQIARELRGNTLKEVYDKAVHYLNRFNEPISLEKLHEDYGHLNPGMQRMSLGNRIRGAMKRAGATTLPKYGDDGLESGLVVDR